MNYLSIEDKMVLRSALQISINQIDVKSDCYLIKVLGETKINDRLARLIRLKEGLDQMIERDLTKQKSQQ